MAEHSGDNSSGAETLAALNKDFKRSKVMQILRFLHDQDMLNKRFKEIDMDSDQDTETGGTASDSDCSLTPQQRLARIQEANSVLDSDETAGSDCSIPVHRHRRSKTAVVDSRLQLDFDDGSWAVASPKVSPVPPAETRKMRAKSRSKTEGEKPKRVLKKLNVRPASAIGNGPVKNTQIYSEALRQSIDLSKPKSSPSRSTGYSRRIGLDKSNVIWEPSNYPESDFGESPRAHVIRTSMGTASPTKIISDKLSIVPVRGNPSVADSLLRVGGGLGAPYRPARERPLRFATDQFEIHEIGTLHDGADVNALRKSRVGLTEIADPLSVTAITMVKLPPLDKGKLVTGSNLVNTC